MRVRRCVARANKDNGSNSTCQATFNKSIVCTFTYKYVTSYPGQNKAWITKTI